MRKETIVPLIIGELNARIEMDDESGETTPTAPRAAPTTLDEETRRLRAAAADRFEAERHINQRDPDRLGGG
jgi:hypothetical protein